MSEHRPAYGVYPDTATEQQHQEWLFDAIRRHEGTYPVLAWAFHCPNEGRHTASYRAKQARQGVKAGIPDVLLPLVMSPYHGLALELKVRPNKPTAAQAAWLEMLAGQGWYVSVCYSWQEAWELVEAYVGGRMT